MRARLLLSLAGSVLVLGTTTACIGNDEPGWVRTGHEELVVDGLLCLPSRDGDVKYEGHTRYECQHRNDRWRWQEMIYDLGGPKPGLAADGAPAAPGIAVLPGSVLLVSNAAGESTIEFALGDDAAPPTLSLTREADGTLTADPSAFTAPLSQVCPPAEEGTQAGCLALTLRGAGPARTVTVDPNTGEVRLPLDVVVEIDAVTGFGDLPADCRIGPVGGTLTGSAMLTTRDLALAPTTVCGAYNDLFNGVLGLPGTVDTIFAVRITLP